MTKSTKGSGNRFLFILLLLPSVALAAADTRAQSISLFADGQRLSTVLAALSELSGREFLLDDEMLGGALPATPIYLSLAAVDIDGAAQAIAHAIGCRWSVIDEGRLHFSRADRLPTATTLRVASYSLAHPRSDEFQALVRSALEPWLGGHAGLAYHPPLRRWVATLDQHGHRRLEQLLSALERPAPRLPPLLSHPGTPGDGLRLARARRCTSWSELLVALGRGGDGLGLSVSLPLTLTARPPAAPLTLPAGTLAELRIALAGQGLHAVAIDGVLCCGETPAQPRLHPAQRARLLVIPVAQLGDRLSVEAEIARLRRDCAPEWWQQPGAVLTLLPDTGLLLAYADEAAQRALLARIAELEREPPAYRGR